MPFHQRELLGDAECLPGRQDRHLRDRVGVLGEYRNERVASLVDGDRVLLLGQQHVGAFPAAEQDPVPCRAEIDRRDDLASLADGEDRRLVGQVGQVGAGEARGSAGNDVQVDVSGEALAADMHGQDRGPLGQRGQRDDDLPVEPPGPQQRRVKHLGPVGRAEHDDALGHVEPVHFRQQLVERLLALVVGDHGARPGPALADGVDLVDEDDDRGALACLGEQIPDPGRPDPDEHLHETGAGDGEERHRRLAGHGAGQQRLAGAGRPDHQHAARCHRACPAVALGVTEEVDHLDDLRLGALVPGYVVELRQRPLGVEDLGPGPAHPENALQGAARAAGHPAEEVEDDDERQEQEQEVEYLVAERRAGLLGGDAFHAVRRQLGAERRAGRAGDHRRVRLAIRQGPCGRRVGAGACAAERHVLDLVRARVADELRVAEGDLLGGVQPGQDQVQQQGHADGGRP